MTQLAGLGQPALDAGQEVVLQFSSVGRLLEGRDLHAGRVHGSEHVADRVVLAPGVHCLQHDQHGSCALDPEALLQRTQMVQQARRSCFCLGSIVDTWCRTGVESRQDRAARIGSQQRPETGHRREPSTAVRWRVS